MIAPNAQASTNQSTANVPANQKEWMLAWARDPSAVMSDIYRHHAVAVRLRARTVCAVEDSFDVSQEVFLRLWNNPGGFDPARGSLRTYLMIMARSVALDAVRGDLRRRRRDEGSSLLSPAACTQPPSLVDPIAESIVDSIVDEQTARRVQLALAQLAVQQRQTIETAFYDELSFSEIARRSGIPEGTVKSRVRLGLQRLRPALGDLSERGYERSTEHWEYETPELAPARQLPRRRAVGPLTSVLLASAAVASCTAEGEAAGDRIASNGAPSRITIATTVAPITSIVTSIVGDRATVTGIIPEGTNSHTFEPRPSVAELLSTVDVLYMNGLSLEEPTRRLAESNLRSSSEIVELGELTIPESDYIFDFSFPLEEGKPNPHLWTDPTLARRYAEIIKDDVSSRDPDNADYYAANYERFAAMIDDLDEAMRASFGTIPTRQLLTYHDAYAYFAETYDWEVIGAIQISDFGDPTPAEVARLIEQVETSGVPAIFGSEVFPSPVLEQIGKEAGVAYIDDLRDDDLPGKPGDAEHSWLGLMLFDYITMTEALGGDATALRGVAVRNLLPDQAVYPQ